MRLRSATLVFLSAARLLSACYTPGVPREMCNGQDDDGDGQVDEDAADALDLYRDEDEDGFGDGRAARGCPRPGWAWADGDCDDLDPALFPGAPERCDGRDQDCDGEPTPLEVDADGDGFAPCQGDCDDDDPTTHPGATEICDGLDQNCDGDNTDEFDVDQDGFSACAGDCAPLDPFAHPDAIEDCDGVDNDCDGEIDGRYAVPRRFPTPQAAVDAAPDGALICLDEGVHPGFDANRPVTVRGRGRGLTIIEVVRPPLILTTGAALEEVTVRPTPEGAMPVMRLIVHRLRRVEIDLSPCGIDGACPASYVIQATAKATWDQVDLRGGRFTVLPGGLLYMSTDVQWSSGSISDMVVDLSGCGADAATSTLFSPAYNTDVRVHDITAIACERPGTTSSVGFGGLLDTEVSDIHFVGDWSHGDIRLFGAHIHDLTLPANRAPWAVRATGDIQIEDVGVGAGVTLLENPVRVTLRRVELEAGASLARPPTEVREFFAEDVTAVDPLFVDPWRIHGLTVRGGSLGSLVRTPDTEVRDLDLRGVTFTGTVFDGPVDLARATLAGNTFGAAVLGDGSEVRHATFAANAFAVPPLRAPLSTPSHVVFAFNTGDGGISDAIPANYLHRHDDVTAIWSPRAAVALSYGDPRFTDTTPPDPVDWDLTPGPGSPLVDAGPSDCLDADLSLCDIGGTGGWR